LGLKVQGLRLWFRVKDLKGFEVRDRVQGLGFYIQDLGSRAHGLRFKV